MPPAPYSSSTNQREDRREELKLLHQRSRLLHCAINLCSGSALFACVLVVIGLLSDLFGWRLLDAVIGLSLLAGAAILSLIASIVYFLWDVTIAFRKRWQASRNVH
ncbi:MAG: DUF2721 domain-containing protein [Burkholderiales bacterium]|nr:DUF2721 domain-containing protein [Burkholderiales bacterium]